MIEVLPAEHAKYMTTTFTEEELFKIGAYIDNNFDCSSDQAIWASMVRCYLSLDPNKKTKAYLYKMMVLNMIVPDQYYDKHTCILRNTCPQFDQSIRVFSLDGKSEMLGTKPLEKQFFTVCNRLDKCCLLPGHNIDVGVYAMAVPSSKYATKHYIDDSILTGAKE